MDTVHYMQFGHTACLLNGPPKNWPKGHKWDANWKNVTCKTCIAGKEIAPTFSISEKGDSMLCLRCKQTTKNKNDIEHHYCPTCDVYHEDIWPPARRAWLEHPDRTPRDFIPWRASQIRGALLDLQMKDLNELNVAATITMLEQITFCSRVMDQAITNAAGIMMEVPGAEQTLQMLDWVKEAAYRLAEIECASGFEWENQKQDWESICHWIACYLVGNQKCIRKREIQEAMCTPDLNNP